MTMITRTLIATTSAAAILLGIAGCAFGPTNRADVCQQFDQLGTDYLSANGLFDNLVFDQAGNLADAAGRYPGSPDLSGDAAALKDIAKSTATTGDALVNATGNVAELCGHPLGVGTTNYNDYYPVPTAIPVTEPATTEPATTEPPAPPLPTTTTTSNGDVTDEASAQAALQQQIDNDRASAEALVGQWVPQLSSKTYGLVANGVTYDYQQIWQDFQSISQQHPDALLVWSSDYSSFMLPDYYVTILPISYPSGSAAASWCTSNGLGANDCYAKLISHTAGPKGSSVNP